MGQALGLLLWGPSFTGLMLRTLDLSCRVVGKLDNNAGHDDNVGDFFLSTDIIEMDMLSVVGGDQWRTIEMVFYRLDGKDVVQQHLSFRTLAEWSGHRR